MHSSNFSSSNGSTEDLFRDSIDSCDNDITEKVRQGGCGQTGLAARAPWSGIGMLRATALGMWETQELGVGSPDHLDTSIPPHPNMTAIHTPSVGGPGLSPTVVRFSVPWTLRFSPPPPYGR